MSYCWFNRENLLKNTWENFPLATFLPYLVLAPINPVYLLLTDKTNGAGILIIIKRHFDDYIHKQHISKRHNPQVDVYFIFAMQLKN